MSSAVVFPTDVIYVSRGVVHPTEHYMKYAKKYVKITWVGLPTPTSDGIDSPTPDLIARSHFSAFASLLDLLHNHLLDVDLCILKDDLDPATGAR